MAHAPQFLKFVNDSKKRVKETNVQDVKRRLDGGEKQNPDGSQAARLLRTEASRQKLSFGIRRSDQRA